MTHLIYKSSVPHVMPGCPEKPTIAKRNQYDKPTLEWVKYERALASSIAKAIPVVEEDREKVKIECWNIENRKTINGLREIWSEWLPPDDVVFELDAEFETSEQEQTHLCTACRVDCLAALGKGACKAPIIQVARLKAQTTEKKEGAKDTQPILATYLFPNHNVATFGLDGGQIPELQGQYTLKLHVDIYNRSDGYTKWNGFPPLPHEEADRLHPSSPIETKQASEGKCEAEVFAEWLMENRWRIHLPTGDWERPFSYKQLEVKTTRELYELFRKSGEFAELQAIASTLNGEAGEQEKLKAEVKTLNKEISRLKQMLNESYRESMDEH